MGTGSMHCYLMPTNLGIGKAFSGNAISDLHLVPTRMRVRIGGSVATDLNYLDYVVVVLRGER